MNRWVFTKSPWAVAVFTNVSSLSALNSLFGFCRPETGDRRLEGKKSPLTSSLQPPAYCLRRILAGLAVVSPGLVLAASEKGTAVAELPQSPLGVGAMMQTMGGLLLILVVIFALGWLFRRFGKLPQAGKGMVTVLGGVSLGPRERAVVLQVGEIRILVGVAPGRVQTLHVLDAVPDRAGQGQHEEFRGQLQAEMEEATR